MRRAYERKLGGYTGDCLGAVQQASELGMYLGVLAALRPLEAGVRGRVGPGRAAAHGRHPRLPSPAKSHLVFRRPSAERAGMELILVRHTRPLVAGNVCYGATDLALAPTFEEEAARVVAALPPT